MEKKKLTEMRVKKGLTQQQLADLAYMDVSTYNRKEKGILRIRDHVWVRLAKALDVPLEDIYEADERLVFIKDNATGNEQGSHITYDNSESLLELQYKVAYLEKEIQQLKQQLSSK
jgi:transcriptional regulator with XRE-family HTH domain